jgi:hypothetical protein
MSDTSATAALSLYGMDRRLLERLSPPVAATSPLFPLRPHMSRQGAAAAGAAPPAGGNKVNANAFSFRNSLYNALVGSTVKCVPVPVCYREFLNKKYINGG